MMTWVSAAVAALFNNRIKNARKQRGLGPRYRSAFYAERLAIASFTFELLFS
jgi:hypothetical protein